MFRARPLRSELGSAALDGILAALGSGVVA